MTKPSIAIWIDPATQNVKVDFRPQTLHPSEYGVALSMVIVHIARLFTQSNPGVVEEEVISELRRGLEAGIAQRPKGDGGPLTAH